MQSRKENLVQWAIYIFKPKPINAINVYFVMEFVFKPLLCGQLVFSVCTSTDCVIRYVHYIEVQLPPHFVAENEGWDFANILTMRKWLKNPPLFYPNGKISL